MALTTGTPLGTLETQEDIYLEGAPNIYFQDYTADPLFNPDADGFYWNLSGSATYPAFEIGCPNDVSFTEDLTINDVLCDNVGVKDTIQQRNYIQLEFTIRSFFPLQTLRHMLGGGAVTETSPTQKFGFGQINNDQRWMVYAPKVYNTDVGDYVWIHLNKAKFVEAWTVNMPFGSNWEVTGLRLRAYADTTKPADQYFGMFGRSDVSVIP
jgi:hypothetical protein